jgi:hypothetical protein
MPSSQEKATARAEAEPIEVSYAVFSVDPANSNIEELLQKIAAIINVQLTFEREHLPFVPFNGFDRARREDKVLLYGRSGCGKSRGMYEIFREKVGHCKTIYIINPRNPVANESGRTNLVLLAEKFGQEDLVLWDNFPDDLVKRDLGTAIKALQMISTRNTRNLVVTLKPRYLEMYSKLYHNIYESVPELSPHEVTFNVDNFGQILVQYGATVKQFRGLYDLEIAKNTHLISKILWQKDPIPITILAFYKELLSRQRAELSSSSSSSSSSQPNIVAEAKKLLPATDYYENQFRILSDSEERRSDKDFLYTLKLCHELGINTTDHVVKYMQEKIFGSSPPREPVRNLSIWIYLSGRYYSMHDAVREAIRFEDVTRKEIVSYLAENFLTDEFKRKIGNEESLIHQLGIFFGKNIQFLPYKRTTSQSFLPEHMHEYMTKNLHFAVGLGLGCGESILSVDEELRQAILKQTETPEGIEFTRGLGNSLGHNFQLLKEEKYKDYRSKILGTTYSGLPFARYLGESLGGGAFKDFPKALQDEIIELIERNNQFADGLGVGLGHVFSSLPATFQNRILSIAEKNSELTRGLGTGFGETFALLDSASQQDVFERARKNSEFAFGLGCGFGRVFDRFNAELQKRIYDLMENDGQLSYGFGIYSTLTNYHQYNDVQLSISEDRKKQEKAKMMNMSQKNPRFALGMGIGVGFSLGYLSEEDKGQLFNLAEQNSEFARGIGNGFGLIFKQVRDLRMLLYEIANRNIEFARGLGIGVGFTMLYLDHELQREVFAKAEYDSGFAYGLGYGLGYIFSYLKEENRREIVNMANTNSEFAQGLGFGLGYIMPYLRQEFQDLAFDLSDRSREFAHGLGFGLGMIFKHLQQEDRTRFITIAQANTEFSRGFGISIGRVFQYLTEDECKEILTRAKENVKFAEGLGEGLGFILPFLQENSSGYTRLIFGLAQENAEVAKGLGAGYGRSFRYLSQDQKNQFARIEKENIKFAEGWGWGLGYSFIYLDEYRPPQKLEQLVEILKHGYSLRSLERPLQQSILAKVDRGSGTSFARGLGTGLSRIFRYLPEEFQERLFQKAKQNAQFANGLGTGLGQMFQYLSEAQREEMITKAEENEQFGRGFGFGLGYIFRYLEDQLQQQLLSWVLEKKGGFVRGLGAGFANAIFFSVMSEDLKEKVFSMTEKSSEFAIGLGLGLSDVLPYVRQALIEKILGQARRNAILAIGLGFGLGHSFEFLPNSMRETIFREAKENDALARGFGNGSGHIFHRLNPRLQESILEKAETNREFTIGLSEGLGRDFKDLDKTTQNKLLNWAYQKVELAYGLGEGLGRNFLSLSPEIRQKVLAKASEVDNEFTKGLRDGLDYSFRYLGKDLQSAVLKVAERNPSFANKAWKDS